MEKVRIYCKNTDLYLEVTPGTKLIDLITESGYDKLRLAANINEPILAAYVDNQLKELSFPLYMAHSVEFLDINNADGRRCYNRSLSFVLQKAVYDLYPEYLLILDYTIPQGLYGKLVKKDDINGCRDCRDSEDLLITVQDVKNIKNRMDEIIAADSPFMKIKATNEEAISLFKEHGQLDKARLFKSLGKFFLSVYYLQGYGDTFYGPLLYSTSYLDNYDLIKYNSGFCLQFPSEQNPHVLPNKTENEKLFEVFKENSTWCSIIGAKDIGTINEAIHHGFTKIVIQVAEALHERKYAHIADTIYARKGRVKLVLISGPSSSGKTTTSKRIALQLKVLGMNPIVIAMDNYFVNREDTPVDEHGNYDFENVDAMDLAFLNEQLNQLFAGEEIEMPKFDFAEGKRFFDGSKIKMGENDIVVMEGIHALNPILTSHIKDDKKFKIYASALTSLSIDENNSISTTDNRLLRRMVRDNNFRGTSAEDTLQRWQSVKNGEYRNIFPFQENADIMFNSALIYELPLLKHYAEPLLRRIRPSSPSYATALRLLKFLSYIVELNPSEINAIPPTSVMREFIGGSTFDY